MAKEPNQEPEENNRWGKIKGFFLDNPTLALTLLYLYVTAVGMLYSAVLYGKFGINIFDYSEIADFLLAALKNPDAILTTGFQLIVILMALYVFPRSIYLLYLLWMTIRGRREIAVLRRRRYGPRFEPSYARSLVLIGAVIVFVLTYANAAETASDIKNGEKPAVEVRYRSFSGSAGQVTVPGLEFIGGTGRAAFFYDADAKRTIVIPQAQIVSIEVPDKRSD